MFQKILIANRGEIAVRIIRACRELGMQTVAVYSEADRSALHVRYADEAYLHRPGPGARIRTCGATRSSTSPARAAPTPSIPAMASWPSARTSPTPCEDAGLVFIGPRPSAIAAMGDKAVARATVAAAGVPVVPGTEGEGNLRDEEIIAHRPADRVPAADQGHRRRRRQGDARGQVGRRSCPACCRPPAARPRPPSATATSTWRSWSPTPATSSSRSWPTAHGNVIHLGERECSLQRRHQKLLEEVALAVHG